jgi:hypothetical protein
MKEQHPGNPMRQRLGLILFGLALLGTAKVAVADDLIVNTFDTDISGIDWQNFRSYASGHDEIWDGLQDASGDPNSSQLTGHWLPIQAGARRGTTSRLPLKLRRSIPVTT